MLVTTPPTSDDLPNQPTQPDEPPRVYDIYSYADKSPNTRPIYIQNAATADVAISQLKSKVLGFDLEWRPNFVKGNPENPVALVQLASEDTILLIHVSFMQGTSSLTVVWTVPYTRNQLFPTGSGNFCLIQLLSRLV